MRGLKVMVVVMGVLLVIGTVALIAAIIFRANNRPARPATTPAAVDRGASLPVEIPAGAKVIATELSGDRLLVRLALPQGGEELMLFNARDGARVAAIELRPAVETKP